MSKILYVLPVHNDAERIGSMVARVTSYLERLPGSEVLLVENGSSDMSWSVAQELATRSRLAEANEKSVPIHAYREESAGLGYAYARGLAEAVDRFGPSTAHWAVLTASDLPFGFSDLEAALVALERGGTRILVGSKAHPHSRVATTLKRRTMTYAYRVARRVALGMRVGDSQGSVFVRLDLAAELAPRVSARDFFYSTELCHLAERAGESIFEVPVVLEESVRPSTVRPLRDSVTMARQLLRLRAKKTK